jgi:hypothetical protein
MLNKMQTKFVADSNLELVWDLKGSAGQVYCGQCLKVEGAFQKEGYGQELWPSGAKWEGYWHEDAFTKGLFTDGQITLIG